jgi:hypothetical protein
MKLPNFEKASIPGEKITHYLLSPSHPDGRAPLVRAVWFIGTDEEIPRLVTAYPQ